MKIDNPKKNSEGYADPTAYYGTKPIVRQERQDKQIENAHRQLINSFLSLASLAGFEVEGRIVLRHRKTGRIFK
jgi:hypothetical protein